MAWQILATYTIEWPQWNIEMVYQAPENSGITQWKLVVNNFSDDMVIVYLVWWPWRELVWWVLQWVWWSEVTEEERKQRILYWWNLKRYERFVEDWLMFWDLDQIWAEWKIGVSNIEVRWDLDIWAYRKEELKEKVLLWTATAADKQELMLLSWWAYVVQNNTNNCSCP